jgi:hypothetical protein
MEERMQLWSGITEWRNDLQRIYATDEVRGIEKVFDLSIFALKIGTLSQIIQFFWGRRERGPGWFIDVYVLVATVVLIGLLPWSDSLPRVSAIIACYLLASTIIVLLNVLFLSKLSFIGPVASHERTLLLLIVNVIQVVLAFAILYRGMLPHLSSWGAVFKTLLVFGTIGYPEGAEAVVGWQIVVDFVLLAVFLSFFVGRLGDMDCQGTRPQAPDELIE